MVDWCTTRDELPVPGTTVEIWYAKIRPFLVPGTVDVVYICSVAQWHSRGFCPIFSCFPQPQTSHCSDDVKTISYKHAFRQRVARKKFKPFLRASPPVTLFYQNGLIAWQKCPKIIPPVGRFDILVTLFRTWHAISEIKRMKIEWIACLFSTCLTHWSQISESLE